MKLAKSMPLAATYLGPIYSIVECGRGRRGRRVTGNHRNVQGSTQHEDSGQQGELIEYHIPVDNLKRCFEVLGYLQCLYVLKIVLFDVAADSLTAMEEFIRKQCARSKYHTNSVCIT
jgi:hypothetical protein